MEILKPNNEKNLYISVNGISVARYPVKTPLVKSGDNLLQIIKESTSPYLEIIKEKNRVIVIGEKAVSISQGRGFPVKDIKPSMWAKFFVKYVTKSNVGIGLGAPETLELAFREVGIPRMLIAAIISGITKPFGIKGMFYRIAGQQARSIDGPVDYAIPPYNTYAVMAAKNPQRVTEEISKAMNDFPIGIIDANDIGQNLLGATNIKDPNFIKKAFKDNPLGQGSEQTPIAIVAWN